MSYMFSDTNLDSIFGLEYWDTSKVTDMRWMFNWATFKNQPYLFDLSGWNVCNVTNYDDFNPFNVDSYFVAPYFGDSSRCNGGLPA